MKKAKVSTIKGIIVLIAIIINLILTFLLCYSGIKEQVPFPLLLVVFIAPLGCYLFITDVEDFDFDFFYSFFNILKYIVLGILIVSYGYIIIKIGLIYYHGGSDEMGLFFYSIYNMIALYCCYNLLNYHVETMFPLVIVIIFAQFSPFINILVWIVDVIKEKFSYEHMEAVDKKEKRIAATSYLVEYSYQATNVEIKEASSGYDVWVQYYIAIKYYLEGKYIEDSIKPLSRPCRFYVGKMYSSTLDSEIEKEFKKFMDKFIEEIKTDIKYGRNPFSNMY